MSGPSLRRAYLALFLLLVGCAHPGKPPPAPVPVTKARTPPPGLFLYRVERGGTSSYLLGTIHLGFGFDEVLTPAARAGFERAELVITETDVGADAAERMMRAALLPADQSLQTLLEPVCWQTLESRLEGQVPTPVLVHLRPWLPAVLLGIMELTRAFDELRPGKSGHMMDVELMEQARQKKKRVEHLESVDEQIAVFEGISLDEQVAELKHALTEQSTGQSRELVKAFASGDEQTLSRALFDATQLEQAPGFYKAVLFDRNARWLPVLERALAAGNTFVAVGAAHLLGDGGLLASFKARGFSVTRVY